MDNRHLLRIMARQLYLDMRFITQQSPTQIVDDEGARTYNALLARVREAFPTVDAVRDFNDWAARTIKYKDALVVCGQLHALIAASVGPVAAKSPAAAVGTPEPGGNPAARDDYDDALYGPDASRRQEDGTIPFSLDLDE